MKPAIFFLFAASALAIPTQAQQVVECRDLAPNGYVAPNESIINGKACRPAGTRCKPSIQIQIPIQLQRR
jgi:hypothetical protein